MRHFSEEPRESLPLGLKSKCGPSLLYYVRCGDTSETTNEGHTAKLNELSESRPGDVKHRWCSRNYKENRCNHGMGHDPSLRKGGSVGNGPHPAMWI